MKDDKNILLQVHELKLYNRNDLLVECEPFTLSKGEILWISGGSADMQTRLGKALCGKEYFRGKVLRDAQISWVGQKHSFTNLSNLNQFYLQQRYQSSEAENAYTLRQVLSENGLIHAEKLVNLGIAKLLDKPMIQLSNGEHKKVQIAHALSEESKVLVFDQPFAGLDVQSRETIAQIFKDISRKGKVVVVIGDFTSTDLEPDHTLFIDDFVAIFDKNPQGIDRTVEVKKIIDVKLLSLLLPRREHQVQSVVELKNVSVKYGGVKIIEGLDWEILQGEAWSLKGRNGSGKSTLLALILADHPQAYSNDIRLFGKSRGSGESIWDIKKRIGFLSPELLQYYDKDVRFRDVVASGFFHSIGLHRKISKEQYERVDQFLHCFSLTHLGEKTLQSLTKEDQYWAFLLRALVNNPDLLIFDEPFQGLDEAAESRFLDVVRIIIETSHKTMIFVSHHSQNHPQCITKTLTLE